MQRELFNWKDEYKTGLVEVDTQHMKIFEIIGFLFAALQESRGPEVVHKVLGDLNEYANIHFAMEENYFRQFNYAGMGVHIAEHNAYRARIAEFIRNTENANTLMSYEILDFLEDWWIDHVTGIDREYVPCFKEHGVK